MLSGFSILCSIWDSRFRFAAISDASALSGSYFLSIKKTDAMYDTKHCLESLKPMKKCHSAINGSQYTTNKLLSDTVLLLRVLKPCQDLIYLVLVLPSDTHHGLLCQMVESIGRSMEYLKRFYL